MMATASETSNALPPPYADDCLGAGAAGAGCRMVGGVSDRDLLPTATVLCRDDYMRSRVRSAVICHWRCRSSADGQTATAKTVRAVAPCSAYDPRHAVVDGGHVRGVASDWLGLHGCSRRCGTSP